MCLEQLSFGDLHSSHVTTIFPWSFCQYSREILIDQCKSLLEVFESQWINNIGGGITSTSINEGNGDTHNTSLVIPRPENIYVPQLVNLKKLVIKSCNLLKHVFTFSTLGSLKQLEELMIHTCKAMEVIVKKDNEEQRNVVDFPRLKSLELKNLPNLKGFFLGMNDFKWQLLEKVMIDYCPKMMVFTSGQSTALKLNYMHTSLGKHSLECGLNFHVTRNFHEWSFHNLIEVHMEWKSDVKYVIPSNELLHLKKLVWIKLNDCRNLEEVFEVEEAMEEGLGLELLFREEKEEVIAMKGIDSGLVKSQTVVEIPNLTQVELKDLHNLKYIWKSNHHVRRMLEFPNLTTISIVNCGRLEHVFTSSMVGSLQQLQDLHISDCPNMEVIVRLEGEEFEYDVTVKEIECLKSMRLEKLEALEGFCLGEDNFLLPLLETLEIKECPKITIFSKGQVATPTLNVIDTSFGRCYIREDINHFIKTKLDEVT
ncbi:putative leucine-rich repeat domain superfamily [Helianthus anomalus]